ncbi:MAG: hypothetical protein OEM97_07060 [Acidimicrobiia bacterium]|nr:hypothetical protein [Acidimicrobiia bacterium]
MLANLGGGERLAVLGAFITFGGWLLFDLLIDEYSLGHLTFALAVVILAAAFAHHRGSSGSVPLPYPAVLFGSAGMLGLLGVWDFVEEVRNGIFDTDGATIIGALIYYVGTVMAGIGGLQLRGRKG